jgi:hypothetical protein
MNMRLQMSGRAGPAMALPGRICRPAIFSSNIGLLAKARMAASNSLEMTDEQPGK